ncbi:hypothetical protein GWK47_026352 [Chionoecetes opilio]|uniref:Uncharacterized protein n=1 Tax=Chionoecetes opilio TaxID=41210 RepID=A0A8J8WCI6_CHIOP|nr:hypothetical protein GWK47_026352 [Chionoecetes opilio]
MQIEKPSPALQLVSMGWQAPARGFQCWRRSIERHSHHTLCEPPVRLSDYTTGARYRKLQMPLAILGTPMKLLDGPSPGDEDSTDIPPLPSQSGRIFRPVNGRGLSGTKAVLTSAAFWESTGASLPDALGIHNRS